MIPYVTIVQQYERLGVFWLGNFKGLRGPGMQILFWPFHRGQKIDLREDVIDIPRQANITRDNAPIDIDFLVYRRVVEEHAERSILDVVDHQSAVVGIATTTLRAVIGELTLDEVLSQRDRINEDLRQKLDEITERWGIKVTRVEIREVEPARDIQEAMNRQMAAERIRRAVVTEAEGTRTAAELLPEADSLTTFAIAMVHHFRGEEDRAEEMWLDTVNGSAQGFWPAEAELLFAEESAGS